MKNSDLSYNTLQLLKAYIASHAVFNALTYVQNQIAADEKRSALKALSTFANFIRKTADDIDKPQRNLSKEWEMLKVYAKLEQWRFGDRLSIEFDEQFNDHIKTASMLFVPFLEQVILIGLSSSTEQLEIRIQNDRILGLYIQSNFAMKTNKTAALNAEQANRKQLLDERIVLMKDEYQINPVFEGQNATLKIELK